MDGLIVSETPKYLDDEITDLVINIINKKGIKLLGEELDIDPERINIFLERPKIYTLEMYEIASKITEISLDDLLEIEKYDIKPNFRKEDECDVSSIMEFINDANILFDEIINCKRLNKGDIYE